MTVLCVATRDAVSNGLTRGLYQLIKGQGADPTDPLGSPLGDAPPAPYDNLKIAIFFLLYDGVQAMKDMWMLGSKAEFQYEICLYDCGQ